MTQSSRLVDSGNKAKQLLSASPMGVDLLSDGNFCGKENRPTDIPTRPSDSDLLGTTDGESPLSTKDDCSIISDLSSCSFVSPEQKPSVQFEGNQVGEEYIDQLEVFSIEARPIDAQQNPFETDNLIERLLYYDSWSNVADADFSRLERSEISGLFDDFLQHYSQYSSQRDFNLSYLLSAFSNLRTNKEQSHLGRLIENNDVNSKAVNQEIQPYLNNEKLCFKTLLIGNVKVFEASKVRLEDRLIAHLYTQIHPQKKSDGLISRMKNFKEMKTLIDLPQKRGYGEKPSFDFFNQFNYLKKKISV